MPITRKIDHNTTQQIPAPNRHINNGEAGQCSIGTHLVFYSPKAWSNHYPIVHRLSAVRRWASIRTRPIHRLTVPPIVPGLSPIPQSRPLPCTVSSSCNVWLPSPAHRIKATHHLSLDRPTSTNHLLERRFLGIHDCHGYQREPLARLRLPSVGESTARECILESSPPLLHLYASHIRGIRMRRSLPQPNPPLPATVAKVLLKRPTSKHVPHPHPPQRYGYGASSATESKSPLLHPTHIARSVVPEDTHDALDAECPLL